METHVFDSCIRGHHVSKDFWTPVIYEELVCAQESGNPHDPYAVEIKKGSVVVGHVPRNISAVCSLFLRAGTITATVTNSRQYSNDLPQGGLEVPCVLKFCGEARTIDKVRRLLPANKEQDSDKPPPLKKVKLLSEVVVKDGITPNNPPAAESSCTKALSLWLALDHPKLTLTEEDKRILFEGDELTDKHINFAQALIKKQFKNIYGLALTFLFSASRGATFSADHPAVQIVHTRGNHWIVATSDGSSSKIFVYDTLYSDVTLDTKQLITKMFGISQIEVVCDIQEQKGGKDCGVFAIAISTALAYHYGAHLPLNLTFNQTKMREHLMQCFVNKHMTVFA